MTVEPAEDAETKEVVVKECQNCGEPVETKEVNPEQRIEEFLQEKYPDKCGGYAERTAQLGDLRGANDSKLEGIAEEVFEECQVAGRIAIVIAGDTSDSGGYCYFERGEGLVDQWNGYEGARGRDATGKLSEKHGMRGYASYEA